MPNWHCCLWHVLLVGAATVALSNRVVISAADSVRIALVVLSGGVRAFSVAHSSTSTATKEVFVLGGWLTVLSTWCSARLICKGATLHGGVCACVQGEVEW